MAGMRVSVAAGMIALAAAPATQAETIRLLRAEPAFVQLDQGGSARVALMGQGLAQLAAPRARRGQAVADPRISVALGPPSPALRDLHLAARPGAPAGRYVVLVQVGSREVRLPVVLEVRPAIAPITRNLRPPEDAEQAARLRNLLLFGTR
jgi:hypothetical protein